jgi:16S rRNA (guanine527-N7)-methyltransferase
VDGKLRNRLDLGSRELGVPLSAEQLDRLLALLRLLSEWNQRINLTAVRDPVEAVDRHLIDSLAVAAVVPAGTLADVGTGPGFPGLPVALARPDVKVTLVESIHKKAAFVRAAAREMGVAVEVVSERLEAWGPGARGRFDCAVSRAMLAPPEWIAAGATLVAPGGLVVAMVAGAEGAPTHAALAAEPPFPYRLPDGTQRNLLRYRRL